MCKWKVKITKKLILVFSILIIIVGCSSHSDVIEKLDKVGEISVDSEEFSFADDDGSNMYIYNDDSEVYIKSYGTKSEAILIQNNEVLYLLNLDGVEVAYLPASREVYPSGLKSGAESMDVLYKGFVKNKNEYFNSLGVSEKELVEAAKWAIANKK